MKKRWMLSSHFAELESGFQHIAVSILFSDAVHVSSIQLLLRPLMCSTACCSVFLHAYLYILTLPFSLSVFVCLRAEIQTVVTVLSLTCGAMAWEHAGLLHSLRSYRYIQSNFYCSNGPLDARVPAGCLLVEGIICSWQQRRFSLYSHRNYDAYQQFESGCVPIAAWLDCRF